MVKKTKRQIITRNKKNHFGKTKKNKRQSILRGGTGSPRKSIVKRLSSFFTSTPTQQSVEGAERQKKEFDRQKITKLIMDAGIEIINKNPTKYPNKIDIDPVSYFIEAPITLFEKNEDFNEVIQFQYEYLTNRLIGAMNEIICAKDPTDVLLNKYNKYTEILKEYKNKFSSIYELKDIPVDDRLKKELKQSKIVFIDGELRENLIIRVSEIVDKIAQPSLCSILFPDEFKNCEKIEI
jgi:hypothetical protein